MVQFKNPWENGGIHFPGHIGETIDRWFKHGGQSKKKQKSESAFTNSGKELSATDFKDALTKKTVEERVRAISAVFKEGDYITSATIFELTGVSSTEQSGEPSINAGVRDMINHIDKISKADNTFTIYMVGGSDHESTLPIKTKESKTVNMYLEIENEATLELNDTGSKIEIKVDDINGAIVTDFYLPELPNVSLDDNILTVLYIPISLVPKKR